MAKTRRQRFSNDPFAAREAEKYEHPVPSREYIVLKLAEKAVPQTLQQLAEAFGLENEYEFEGLRRRLRAMERDGQIIRNRRGGYGLVSKMDLYRGRVVAHPDGFGFLVPDQGEEDLYLSPKQMRSLLHGDRAVVRMVGFDRRGRKEGALVEVLERANRQVVGRFVTEHGIGFVIPSNKRIHQDIAVPSGMQNGARDGQIVVVEIVEQPSWRSQPIGKVIEVLGDHMAPGMEIDIAIRSYELPVQWPPAVQRQIANIRPEVAERDKVGREDLRDVPLVTIDGEDARDFDDAVFCEPWGKGWRLLVAIADVSHYVQPDSALDVEARQRGNSVYFPGRVIPMLPQILSNELCSLNPEVDRLSMVCEMIMTPTGRVRRKRFFRAVIRSHARLTYDEMANIVQYRKRRDRQRRKELVRHLDHLYALYQVLQKQRERRGAIEFETTETTIQFGKGRKIEQILPVQRNDAHRLIEECMVAANVAAAEFLLEAKIHALYRVHDGPSAEKLCDLRSFLKELGLSLPGGDDPQPKHYAKLLASVKGRRDEHLIQTVLLRSLSQAVYSPDNTGHFGLAFDAYTHFTSPIRRYPDLVVHRAIGHILDGRPARAFVYSKQELSVMGEQCSMTERRADEATRDAVDWLKCEYMLDKVGETYDGIISGVTSFGLFVELNEIFVEGLVHVTSLHNDYYHFDALKHRLVGDRTRKVYRLGDPIRVRVLRVNLDEKKIDFELVPELRRRRARRRK